MKFLLFLIHFLPFLLFGQVKNKPKTQPKESPHEELRKALYHGKYKDALKYISQGADIRKTDTMQMALVHRKQGTLPKYFDESSGSIPRVGAFLGIILPFVATAEGLAQKNKESASFFIECKIVDISLEDALQDTIKSAERLQIIEYSLQKGANPDGDYKNIPLYLAVKNRDIEAVRLLIKYKAKVGNGWLWDWILPTCECLDSTDRNKYDAVRFTYFKEVIGLILKDKPSLSAQILKKFYKIPVLTKLLLDYYTLEELNAVFNPIYMACEECDLELMKQYERLGFDKFKPYQQENIYYTMRVFLIDNSKNKNNVNTKKCAPVFSYLYQLGFDVNYYFIDSKETFFCKSVKSGNKEIVEWLLTMKPDFCKSCNPLGLLQTEIMLYRDFTENDKNYVPHYNNLLAMEPLLEDYYKKLSKEQKKIILENLSKYKAKLFTEYETEQILKPYIKKLKKL